jgi:hypothetical protein
MSVILDIDLDYFRSSDQPLERLNELLGWANRPVDPVFTNHHEALAFWAKAVTRRFTSGKRLRPGWPTPDMVTVCTSPGFINKALRERLLSVCRKWNEAGGSRPDLRERIVSQQKRLPLRRKHGWSISSSAATVPCTRVSEEVECARVVSHGGRNTRTDHHTLPERRERGNQHVFSDPEKRLLPAGRTAIMLKMGKVGTPHETDR